MNTKIREAVINDYQDLCQVYAELDELHRLNHPELFIEPEDFRRAKEYILGMITDSDKTLFVAEVESKVVAFAECFIQESTNFPVIKKRKWVQLDGIAVKREFKNQNIGSLLFSKVVEWAKSKGIKRIELKVYSFNMYADEFYSGKGFKDLSKVKYLNL